MQPPNIYIYTRARTHVWNAPLRAGSRCARPPRQKLGTLASGCIRRPSVVTLFFKKLTFEPPPSSHRHSSHQSLYWGPGVTFSRCRSKREERVARLVADAAHAQFLQCKSMDTCIATVFTSCTSRVGITKSSTCRMDMSSMPSCASRPSTAEWVQLEAITAVESTVEGRRNRITMKASRERAWFGRHHLGSDELQHLVLYKKKTIIFSHSIIFKPYILISTYGTPAVGQHRMCDTLRCISGQNCTLALVLRSCPKSRGVCPAPARLYPELVNALVIK